MLVDIESLMEFYEIYLVNVVVSSYQLYIFLSIIISGILYVEVYNTRRGLNFVFWVFRNLKKSLRIKTNLLSDAGKPKNT